MQIYVDTYLHMSHNLVAQTANDLPASQGFWMVTKTDKAILMTYEDVDADELDVKDFCRYGTFEGQKFIWVAGYDPIQFSESPQNVVVSNVSTSAFLITHEGTSVRDALEEIGRYSRENEEKYQ